LFMILGIYCMKISLPLNFTITSSTAKCWERLQYLMKESFNMSHTVLNLLVNSRTKEINCLPLALYLFCSCCIVWLKYKANSQPRKKWIQSKKSHDILVALLFSRMCYMKYNATEYAPGGYLHFLSHQLCCRHTQGQRVGATLTSHTVEPWSYERDVHYYVNF
jgi:hypothetical protein